MKPPDQDVTYDLDLLQESERAWKRAAGLRLVYASLYREVAGQSVEGPALEIGSGIGAARRYFPNLVTSDVVQTPYVDRAMSAYAIEPTDEGSPWATIFAVDVLHHLTRPMDFFRSAAAAVAPGGRLILIEPAATPFGCLFYRCCHHEPIGPAEINPPFVFQSNGPAQEFANMGMGVGLFERHRDKCLSMLEEMGWQLHLLRYRDLMAYPATGGYSRRQMLPSVLLRALLRLEGGLPQWLMRKLGLRMVVVLERMERSKVGSGAVTDQGS